MQVSDQVISVVAQTLQEKFGFATTTMLDKAVADVIAKTLQKKTEREQFSLSTMIRGLRAMKGEAINPTTAEQDVAYCKALTTGTTPGSFLVPTIQADEIIQYLSIGGIMRASGARIWPMNGMQKLTIPVATTAPAWVWMAQNSVQQPTDPGLGQLAFDLKERRCLIAVPNQLLAVSVPAFDALLAQLIGLGAAENEDQAFFNTTTISGAPTALFANIANLTSINCAGSANGGTFSYADILNVLAAAVAAKAVGPFCWFMSPRTFFQRALGLVDLQSRPLVIPTLTEGLYAPVQYRLMGWPVYITPFLLENESLGSGTNQAHVIFTNPSRYIHVGQDGNIEIAISTERFFDSAQTAIRAVNHLDWGEAPGLAVVVLKGVN